MLRLDVYSNGVPAKDVVLDGAYLFGQDGVPVRADLRFKDGQITCTKRVQGACGLALLWDAGHSGRFMLSTTRLPDRNKSYNLNVELTRGQITRIIHKREEWGLFDHDGAKSLNKEFLKVRKKFIASLTASDPQKASVLADKALADSITLGEKLTLLHADIFLSRRQDSNVPLYPTSFGCRVDLFASADLYRQRLREAFDFVSIPTPWKKIEPKERQYRYEDIDAWVSWATRMGKPLHAGPLLSFCDNDLPDWLYIWEHDYDALREQIYEHIQRIVQRYAKQVSVWRVVCGIHAENNFNLNFEQIMELTRMSCQLVKQLAPEAQIIVELTMPWGEYYARNQQTIPPLLYADVTVQSGVKFDAFGLQVYMGVPAEGLYVRDLLQISSLLDQFSGYDKGIYVTGCQVPSSVAPDTEDAWGGDLPVPKGGMWHAPWSLRLQAEWLQAFYRIAMSKPFVESICWNDLADCKGHYIPHGGLCKNNMKPKLSYRELRNFRAALTSLADDTVDQQRQFEGQQ